MGTLFTQCAKCGKKTFSTFMHDGGICLSCAAKVAREAADRRAQEEKEERQRAEEIERENKRRVSDLYRWLKNRPELPSLYDIRTSGTIKDVVAYIDICDEIIIKLRAAKDNENFLKTYRSLWENNDLDFPFWSRNAYLAEGMPTVYFQYGIDQYFGEKEYAQKIITNSTLVRKTAVTTPRIEINRTPSKYAPDEDPDFAGLKLSPVTPRTNRMQLADYIVIDVETTGLSPTNDEIVQIAAIKYESFRPSAAFCTYIKPRSGIKEDAQKINGITAEMVADAPDIDEVVNDFRDFTGSKLPLVGHNIIFDLKFLCKAGCISIKPKRKYYDTVDMSKRGLKEYELKNYKLDTIARKVLYIVRDDAHDALSDCITTGLLFDSLVSLITGEN